MELIDQHTKRIMEGCKVRARAAGLSFYDESLEYIVTNRDLLELGPKNMIPTLYDYWVHDVEVLKEKGKYELYPNNPYETVINTRPAISFYNDNNPDWLNVMIFYHVLGHIDFFQNNLFFKHTWRDDFTGRALSDKRLISRLRSEHGRFVDYVIEFARGADNIVGFYRELSVLNQAPEKNLPDKLDYYFDVFLQTVKKTKSSEYVKEIARYNKIFKKNAKMAETLFLAEVLQRHPEFDSLYDKYRQTPQTPAHDVLQFIMAHSPFLKTDDNKWMLSVIQIVRNTSLFFQPQIRTKILNEGWASYWHEKLFLVDDRIKGHEVDFARVNAKVTALPRVGLNPYALGMRLFDHIETLADKGRRNYDFQRLRDARQRRDYDQKTGRGLQEIFRVRENYSDFIFLNTFVDQDFVDKHRLFVVGRRLNQQKGVWEYFVQSRDAKQYKKMLLDQLYHPPHIEVDTAQSGNGELFLNHHFEGKQLVKEFIENAMLGLSYLWGSTVKLETTEFVNPEQTKPPLPYYGSHLPQVAAKSDQPQEPQRVLYTMAHRKLSRKVL